MNKKINIIKNAYILFIINVIIFITMVFFRSLYFFEKVNGFKKKPEAKESA